MSSAVVLESILICERVRVVENMYYVLAGATDTITAAEYPAVVRFDVATRIRLPKDYPSSQLDLEVRIRDHTGADVLETRFRPSVEFKYWSADATETDRSLNLPLYVDGFIIKQPGTYSLSISQEDIELGRTYFKMK